MNVLIATKTGQGGRPNDFSWTEEGELVTFSAEEDGEDIDGDCGCRRSFSGLTSRKGTTTVQVASLDMTREEYVERLWESDQRAWQQFAEKAVTIADADELLRLADLFPMGAVLEKRGNDIIQRGMAQPIRTGA